MATLSFKLRKTSIQLFFSYGKNKRLRYSTGLTIQNERHWDSKKMRVKNILAEINKEVINEKLDEAQTKFNKRYIELALDSKIEVNNDLLREVADEVFNKKSEKEIEEKKELLPFFEWFLDYYAFNAISTIGKPLGKGTLKTYHNTYSILEQFNKEVYKLSYNKITLSFYEDLLRWLYEKNYTTNYIGTIIKNLKRIMNAAYEKDLHTNLDFKKSGFNRITENVTNIYLTTKELEALMNYDLNSFNLFITNTGVKLDKEKLDRARDLFLISAFTGLRVSDFNRLSTENFITRGNVEYLTIEMRKGKKMLAIPVHPMVKKILKKRQGHPPKRLPEQHINYAIKKVAELAEIDENVTKEVTKAGKKTSDDFKKYELISNHTGRRSFCTNAYLSGMPSIDIMAISGHSSEKVFYNYIKADYLEKAKKIAEHPFFQ